MTSEETTNAFCCQTYSLLNCSVLLLNFTLCFCFLGVPPFSSTMTISSSSAILFKFKSVSCNTLYEPTGEILDMLQGMSKWTCFLEYELSMGLEAKIPFLTSNWSSLFWGRGFPERINMILSKIKNWINHKWFLPIEENDKCFLIFGGDSLKYDSSPDKSNLKLRSLVVTHLRVSQLDEELLAARLLQSSWFGSEFWLWQAILKTFLK